MTARQAASILSLPSGINTGPAKRRKHWARQAASILGSPSGDFAEFAPSGIMTGLCRCAVLFNPHPNPSPIKKGGAFLCEIHVRHAPSGAITGLAKRRHYWALQAASILGPPSGINTRPAKRRKYWTRQAASILDPPSGVNTGPAKRREYWTRQAAQTLGPPSGVNTGFTKRRKCCSRGKRDGYGLLAREVAAWFSAL